MKTFSLLLAGLGLFLLAGCGSKGNNESFAVYPVTGKVSLANGQALRGARVRLIAKTGDPNAGGTDAFADLQADGSFTLLTMDNREGAMPGLYKVIVQPATNNPKMSKEDVAFAQRSIPKVYQSEDSTTLDAEVKKESTTLDLKLK
jgi:hypothetical protein